MEAAGGGWRRRRRPSLASFGAPTTVSRMALLFAALTGGACVLTYGLDPRVDRAALEAAAKRAGINGRT